MAEKKISSSRVRRVAQMGRVAGSEGARSMATRAANRTRTEEDAAAALAQRQLAVAEQLVTLLGTMRGAALKIGQLLSVADFGLVDDEHRAEFQAKLAGLQDQAPTVPWKKMQRHLEQGLGSKVDDVFAGFDPTPVAAASIGQVYRAKLDDGTQVAVKVQYPGIARAVRGDVKNLRMFAPAAKGLFPGMDLRSVVDEVEARVLEELDYEHEAANHRTLHRAYRDHPFIRIPNVHTDLCSDSVLVTDWVDGRPLPTAYALDQETRDRVAEILFRFYLGAPYRSRCFSGDPHPGNALLLDDGTLAFLDFGLMKTISDTAAERELASLRALSDGDADALLMSLRHQGFVMDADRIGPQEILDGLRYSQGWYLNDEDPELTPGIVNEVMARAADPAGPTFRVLQHEQLPDELMVQRRVEMLVASTLGNLRPRVNFHRIAREWLYDEPPVTELGKREAAWRSSTASTG